MDVKLNAKLTESPTLSANLRNTANLGAKFGNTQIVSTDDYEKLYNKPVINDVTVQGNKVGEDYHLQDKMHALTTQEIEKILYL